MKIQDKDLYHGAALTQIVEHNSFKALNRASKKYGHYLINTDRHLFVKYRKGDSLTTQHTLDKHEIKLIANEISNKNSVYLCLVCGSVTVCALNSAEINCVIDLNSDLQQWIRVEIAEGGSCKVTGSHGELKRKVTHSSFPDKVFS